MPVSYQILLQNVAARNRGNVHRAISGPMIFAPPSFSGRMSIRSPDNQSGLLQRTLDLLILQTVALGPVHGHAIGKSIENRSREMLQVGHGSLYPALQRLIKDGLIVGEDGIEPSANNLSACTMRRMTHDVEPETLGLVAGLGVGAGIFYYRTLVNAHLARALSPRIVMVHANVHKVMTLANARASHQLAGYLLGLLGQLAGGGAQIATIPAFSPQVCAQELEEKTPLPLISLLDAIIGEVERRKLARVAVFGARVTMETGLFGRLRDVTDVISIRPEEVDLISRIYGEVVRNEKASATEFEELRTLAHMLIRRESLDAILLAGTDFSFVFNPENADFRHLDGARTHIDAIMRRLTC